MALFDIFKNKKGKKQRPDEEKYRQKSKDEGRKKVAEKKEEVRSEEKKSDAVMHASDRASRILMGPSVTEKSARLAEEGVYTFRVKEDATKPEVRKAVEELYHVHVEQVNTVWAHPKQKILRGVRGTKPGFRKAIVSLREGEKIEFV